MKFFYVVRKDKCWHDNYEISNFYNKNYKAEKFILEWNKVFNPNYYEFRSLIEQIRLNNLKDLKFDDYFFSHELERKQLIGIFAPTDDDDWYHPNLILALKSNYCKKYKNYKWDFVKIKDGSCQICDKNKKLLYPYSSNNYAIENPKIDLLLDHRIANEELINDKKIHIEEILSIHINNICSLSLFMHSELKLKNFYEAYELCILNLKNIENVPSYFEKHINSLQSLYKNKLKIKKIFL